jgi:molybdopterin-guanine dinucleotide biosynthesis protein A
MPEAEPDSHEQNHEHPFPALNPILDIQKYGDIGPAGGLLAAHATHPCATLLVVGCDYPLLPPSALQQLILEYEPPLTCFVNSEGFTEPLIALWSPEALDVLERNVKEGRSGLNGVVGMMEGVKLVKPLRETWIMGCNTRHEWDKAMRVLKERHG